ncbi:matrix metalloproteinase-23-like [Neoarius graeffei]|uniref:matrix metalloproteinase-23-like n=1 Tax=Neoarius graeffei TaxID=443677 RepID=UPI00298C4D79|nr:matrix metalloproteinase-23-like [Neoarius graeffei]
MRWIWTGIVPLALLVLVTLFSAGIWRREQEDHVSASGGPRESPVRAKRYAINPLGYKWDHFNITYKITTFPNTLNKDDTRKAISIAFTKWSDVSSLTFTEITNTNKSADIIIGELGW